MWLCRLSDNSPSPAGSDTDAMRCFMVKNLCFVNFTSASSPLVLFYIFHVWRFLLLWCKYFKPERNDSGKTVIYRTSEQAWILQGGKTGRNRRASETRRKRTILHFPPSWRFCSFEPCIFVQFSFLQSCFITPSSCNARSFNLDTKANTRRIAVECNEQGLNCNNHPVPFVPPI